MQHRLHHGGFDITGAYRINAYMVRGGTQCIGFGQAHNAMFTGGIGWTRRSHQAQNGGHINDRTFVGGPHVLQFIFQTQPHPREVDAYHLLPIIEGAFPAIGTNVSGNTRIIHRVIQCAVLRYNGRNHLLHLILLGYIHRNKRSLAALPLDHLHGL